MPGWAGQDLFCYWSGEMTKSLLGIQEFAEAVGVSTFTVRRLIEAGKIRNVSVGTRRLIPATELERIVTEGVGSPRKTSTQAPGMAVGVKGKPQA